MKAREEEGGMELVDRWFMYGCMYVLHTPISHPHHTHTHITHRHTDVRLPFSWPVGKGFG